MPYIEQRTKDRLDANKCETPKMLSKTCRAHTAGQLTYKLQQELLEYIESLGLSYQTLAECLGALEGAKADLTERVLKPYERSKILINGDVWPKEITQQEESTPSNAGPVMRQAADPFEALGVEATEARERAAKGCSGMGD